ncbi:MAG: hypothetical protein ACTHJ3_15850 [Pararhizobium sp.]
MQCHRLLTETCVRTAGAAILVLAASVVASAAPADNAPGRRTHEPPPYMDDRSTPTAVIESMYNALNRHEYTRAYSYWGPNAKKPPFKDFLNGYKNTQRIRLYTGTVSSEGAAGSVYYSVPVSLRAVNNDGTTIVFAGCYTLRLADPSVQAEPPFVPMHIEKSNILRARGRTSQAVPETCQN